MHRRTCGRVPRGDDVFASQCVEGRILRVARTKTLRASSRGRDARYPDTSNSQTKQRNLRESTNPCSTSTRRNARWAQACRASYAQGTHCRALAPAFSQTTDSKHGHPIAPNLLKRRFAIKSIRARDRVWASDITYIDTMEGWLYLAVVLDLRSRRVVGWSMSQSLEATIVLDSLRMALSRRQPGKGVLHHSDRGSQYADKLFRQLLKDHGMKCSMSRKGDCWDNAVVESFNATIKTELIHRTKWITREEARAAVYKWIETWYNSKRLHSTLGYRSPDDFESDEKQPAA